MTKLVEYFKVCLAAAAFIVALIPVLAWLGEARCENAAYAGESIEETVADILALQPNRAEVDEHRANRLGLIITTAAHERAFEPKLITVMVMRESGFRGVVEAGIVRGTSRLELGLMQVHGVALRFRPNNCTLENNAECQVGTGVRFLDYCRDTCPGSTWRWVAYYGMSTCPTEEAAREDQATRRAYAYYQQVGGTQWE